MGFPEDIEALHGKQAGCLLEQGMTQRFPINRAKTNCVIPAKAGIHILRNKMDARLRGHDAKIP